MLVPRLVDSNRIFRPVRYLVLVTFLYFLVTYINTPEAHDAYVDVLRKFKDEKELFLQDYMAHDAEFQQSPDHGLELAKLCANRTWFPEDKAVILSCDPLPGGLGGVKNGHLNCIRFAIEIGSQLILPRMHPRSESDISNLHGAKNSKGISLDYMFDVDHLVASLAASCPQMKVHASLDDLYDKPSLLQPFNVPNLGLANAEESYAILNDTRTSILPDVSAIRPALLTAMEHRLPAPPKKRHWPLRVHLGNSLFVWPTLERGEALRRDLGSLLRTRQDIRQLAGSALYNLAHQFDIPQLLLPERGYTAAGTVVNFTGAHLRTEKDAQAFPDFEIQAGYFLEFLKRHSPSLPPGPSPNDAAGLLPPSAPRLRQRNHVVYLATGLRATDADVKEFRARAAEYDATVVLKHDLFDQDELTVLEHLSWDQRALVDYEIMLRVGHVVGVVESSLAWNIALKRAALYGAGEGYRAFTAHPKGQKGWTMWHDRLSTLYGKSDTAVSRYYGSWP